MRSRQFGHSRKRVGPPFRYSASNPSQTSSRHPRVAAALRLEPHQGVLFLLFREGSHDYQRPLCWITIVILTFVSLAARESRRISVLLSGCATATEKPRQQDHCVTGRSGISDRDFAVCCFRRHKRYCDLSVSVGKR